MSEEKSPEKQEKISFEEGMAQLESIVRQLEENDVPLEKAIDLFQKGMDYSKFCHDKLEEVNQKMDQLIHPDGSSAPFSVPGDGNE